MGRLLPTDFKRIGHTIATDSLKLASIDCAVAELLGGQSVEFILNTHSEGWKLHGSHPWIDVDRESWGG